IEFHVDTQKGWAGFGWNWTSYYQGGAADVTGRKHLKFMLQVEAATPDDGPDPGALQLALRCAKVSTSCRRLPRPRRTSGPWMLPFATPVPSHTC
ncbi:MAG: hypothetical protein V4532_08090, partial [Pseudomonadota bacterium]